MEIHPATAEVPVEIMNTWLAAEIQWDLEPIFLQLHDENIVSQSSFVEPLWEAHESHGHSTPCTAQQNISCSQSYYHAASTEACIEGGNVEEGRGLPTEDNRAGSQTQLDDSSMDENIRTFVPLEEESSDCVGQPALLAPSLIFDLEECLHVQTASRIPRFEDATLILLEPNAQISNPAEHVEFPNVVQVSAGADSMPVVRGEYQRDGDDSLKERFHLEVGYEGSEFTWTDLQDLHATTLAGCSMDQTQAGSQQTCSAVCQHDLETLERMLMSDTPAPETSILEEYLHVQTASRIPGLEDATLILLEPNAQISNLAEHVEFPNVVQVPAGADSMPVVRGEYQRDGDDSLKERFHLEVGYEGSEFTWTDLQDLHATSLPGCSMDQTQAGSQQTYSAVCQHDLETLERMLMSDTPAPETSILEEYLHVQTASRIPRFEDATLILLEPNDQISNPAESVEFPNVVQVPAGADSMPVVCGEYQRDGDDSLKERFHLEVGYEGSEFTWTDLEDLHATTLPGCSMDQTQAGSQQTCSAVCQHDLEALERMLMSDTPAPETSILEECLHVQTASRIPRFEDATLILLEPNAQISNPAESVEFPNVVQVPAGADSKPVVCGEYQRDGDESLKESFHLEVGYEGSEFTWADLEDLHATSLAGCSMDQTQAGSQQTCSAVCQHDLEALERMLMSDTPAPETSNPTEYMQFSPLPAELREYFGDLQADCAGMDNLHGEPSLGSSRDSLPEWVDAMESIPLNDMVKRDADQSLLEAKPRLKRKKLPSLWVGVTSRFNGTTSTFEANYAPPGSDGKVFLGEFSTQEEAKDAYNLVALLHEGTDAKVDLEPYKVEKYVHEVQGWQGKHIADLVCELRLKGRGVDKNDGRRNYKHVERRWAKRKKQMRFEAKVSYECTLPDGGKKRKCTSKAFDTAEEAAKHADMVEVATSGRHAWTNFPLSRYINNLEKDFLPTSVITRIHRTYNRAKPIR